jgi:hypothetical protein
MRDERHFSEKVNQKEFLYPSGELVRDRTTVVSLLTKTHRAESTSTIPRGGRFYYPTEYSGYFFYGEGNFYDYVAQVNSWSSRKRRYVGKGSTWAPCRQNFHFHGCKGFPYHPDVSQECLSTSSARIQGLVSGGSPDLGESLAEAPQTVKEIALSLKSASDLFRALRRRDPSAARRAVLTFFSRRGESVPSAIPRRIGRSMASAALSWRFGWQPMMQSIYDASSYLSSSLDEPDCFTFGVNTPDAIPPHSIYTRTYVGEVEGQYKRGVKESVTYRVRNPQLYSLAQHGLTNPALMAWQVLPLSFVFDWFLPVGNFLNALMHT